MAADSVRQRRRTSQSCNASSNAKRKTQNAKSPPYGPAPPPNKHSPRSSPDRASPARGSQAQQESKPESRTRSRTRSRSETSASPPAAAAAVAATTSRQRRQTTNDDGDDADATARTPQGFRGAERAREERRVEGLRGDRTRGGT